MKTISDFYAKYGTGKNYEDFFQMMLHAKTSVDRYFREKYNEFVNDFEVLFQNDFDEMLWRDYKYITNY